MRRLATIGLLLLAVVVVGAAGYWAGRVALAPPDDPLASAGQPVTYTVVEQTLGQSLGFAAVAEWPATPLGRAWSAGVVTSLAVAAGDEVDIGDVLYSVDLHPVVIGPGDVPAFRDLAAGVVGADVTQLETLLAELGYLDAAPNATFDAATTAAVRAWQRALGVTDDGIVRQGDVLYAPELPLRVLPTEALTVGAPLNGGEVVLQALAAEPSVVIPLTPEQRNLVPLTGRVVLTAADITWEAVIARAVETNEQGLPRLDLVLTAPGGGPVCGDACAAAIPAVGRTNLAAEIIVVPTTSGPVVPTAAIVTDPAGGQSVQLADGTTVPITVVVSTGGLAVVDGVEPGDVLLLPFAAPPDG